jgi:hypothetical protein
VFDSREQAPPTVSWRPTSSSTIVSSGRPRLVRSVEPVVRKMLPWAAIVSGAL